MKRFLPIVAAVVLAACGGVMILGAGPQAQEESKTDKIIKSLTEKVDKLEKRIADLEKKLAEKNSGKLEDGLKGFLEKFGGKFEGGAEGFKKFFEDFQGSVPGLPDFESLPDLFQGFDTEQLLDMLKGQFEGQLPGFFDGLDLEGLLDKFKDGLPKSEPKKKSPKKRSI